MNDEIKEILEDNGELMVRYKDNSFECFDTLPKNVLDYITNLQQDNTMYAQLKDEYEEEIKDLQENNEVLLSSYKAQKDINHQQLSMVIKRDKKIKDLQQENERLKKEIPSPDNYVPIENQMRISSVSHEINYQYFKTLYEKATKDIVIDDLVYKCEDMQKLIETYEKLDIEKEDYKLIIEKLTKELKTTYNKEYYYKYNGKYLKSEINTELLNLLESRGN